MTLPVLGVSDSHLQRPHRPPLPSSEKPLRTAKWDNCAISIIKYMLDIKRNIEYTTSHCQLPAVV